MQFLCDVHIPIKLVRFLNDRNYHCVHVNSILDKWHTKDNKIAKYVDDKDYILITKDADFRDSHYVKNTPKKLVKINLGNISNMDLIKIVSKNLPKINDLNSNDSFIIEIDINNSTFSSMKIIG